VNHDEAMTLASTEYDRLLAVVDPLSEDDWTKQTDNELWDVKALLGHVLATMDSNADMEETGRQQAAAGARMQQEGGYYIDNLTAVQVEKYVDASPGQVAEALRAMAPQALAGRRDTPEPVRASELTPGPPFEGTWTIGYLLDTIYTRDTWMHRVDLCRATGREMVLTADHDGRLVADVVDEWARAHSQPFTLVLTGPAGGTFTQGNGGEELELDAVEFCRILSGRGTGAGLLKQGVAF
jgi:uncharacterized protein (TIGR03083 family)